MTHDFDTLVERRHTDSEKWCRYGDDVLPLWVADMDFPSPEPVIQALRERVEHGIFGYGGEPAELRDLIVARLAERWGWHVSPEDVVFVPGVVVGFNLACQAVTAPGDGVLVQTPVYPPILVAGGKERLVRHEMELTREPSGHYSVDFGAFEAAITERSRIFILCNPHNPVGRVFRPDELERMAAVCLRHGLVICSDEIHCDLVLGGHRHVPIASLDPEIARRTITLMAPSKTFNIAGLDCSFAVIQDAELRGRFGCACRSGLTPHVNILGYAAALAAYRGGQAWLDDLLAYLEVNVECLLEYVGAHLPGIAVSRPEGTTLAWLDCRPAGLPGNAHEFFLRQARVALNDGVTFGKGGQGFVRLNFGCPRVTLVQALDRMRAA
jgi:cysteine-S-conjugate beta-lyase